MAAKRLVAIASYWHSFETEHAKIWLEAEGTFAHVQGGDFVAVNSILANTNRETIEELVPVEFEP